MYIKIKLNKNLSFLKYFIKLKFITIIYFKS